MLGDSAKFSAWLCFEIRPIFLRRVVVIPQKSNEHSVVKVYNVRDLVTADLLQLADDYSLPLHQRNIQDWTDDVASVCRLPQQKKKIVLWVTESKPRGGLETRTPPLAC